jgi:hypothetical protein
MAANLAQKYITNSIVLFIFMTDGGSSYPTAGVQKLRNIQANNPNKFKYAGIEFNNGSQVMKDIARDLNGKTGVAYNAEELTGLFLKSIEIIEYREKAL